MLLDVHRGAKSIVVCGNTGVENRKEVDAELWGSPVRCVWLMKRREADEDGVEGDSEMDRKTNIYGKREREREKGRGTRRKEIKCYRKEEKECVGCVQNAKALVL